MNKVKVTFLYDESCGKWEVLVTGVENEEEAKQALNAVVLTSKDVYVCMKHKVKKTDEGYEITPAILTTENNPSN